MIGSFYNTYHVSEEKVNIDEINYNLGMGNQEEYLPENVIRNYEYYQNRNQDIKIISGKGTVQITENQVPDLTFELKTNEKVKVELPRLYYLGYLLKKDQQKIPVKENANGFLEVELEESGTYKLEYKGTKKIQISYIIMIGSGVLFLIVIILLKKYKIYKN